MIYYPPHHSLILYGGLSSPNGFYEYDISGDSWKVSFCSGTSTPSSLEAFVMGEVNYIKIFKYRKERMSYLFLVGLDQNQMGQMLMKKQD
jgi:hypothetical protein